MKFLSASRMILPLVVVLLAACQKEIPVAPTADNATDSTRFTIRRGNHFCDQSRVKAISTSNMSFTVKFNASAVYTTVDPANQTDINKLWGFSEGSDHQFNSARIGWAYHSGALRLYAYVYDKGVRAHQEITPVTLNTVIPCSIKLNGANYLISANGLTVTMPRGLSTPQANGYQLYPFFGGDETAPQDITLHIQ